MKFIGIKLVNFGNIKFLEKNFDKPLTILSGDNGNGKSTVIKAIRLAVFDSYDGVLQDYVNWDSDEFFIEVKFLHNSVTFVLSLSYNGSTVRTLSFNNETYTGDEAKRKVKELIDLSLLKAAMLSLEQETDIVKSKPAERREYLKKIYNLDFKSELSSLEEEIKELSLERKATETKISSLESKSYLEPTCPEEPFSKEEKAEKEKTLNSVEKNLLEYKSLLGQDNLRREQFSNLEKLLCEEETKIADEKEKILQQQSLLKSLPEQKEKQLTFLEKELKRLIDEKICIQEELSSSLNENEAKISTLKSSLKRPKFVNVDLLNSSRARAEFIAEKLTELKSVSDVCPMCGQKITTEEQIQKRKEDIQNFSAELEEVRARISRLVEDKNEYDDVIRQNDVVKQKISDLEKEELTIRASYEKRAITIDSDIEKVSRELEILEEKFASEQSHIEKLVDSMKSSLLSLEESVTKTKSSMDELSAKFLEEDFFVKISSTEKEVEELKRSLSEYDSYMVKLESYKESLNLLEKQKLEDKKILVALYNELKDQSSSEADKEAELKILKNEFPVYVISRIIKDIESRMNEFLRKTYGGRYSVSVKDKGNSLSIIYGPKNQDVALSSGYERSLFNLAFKIAISRAMNNRCLVLDEADSAASPANAKLFYSVLAGTIGVYFDQIIMVTHKAEVKEMLENEFSPDVITFVAGVPQ